MNNKIDNFFKRRREAKGNLVSIVLPVYNEAKSIPFVLDELFEYLRTAQAKYLFEIIFIDDCSTDNSFATITACTSKAPPNVKVAVLRLAINSGSHIAITAGINVCRGDMLIIMASDGQDPADVIGRLIQEWEFGYELILAARTENLDQRGISKTISRYAWKLMSWGTGIKVPERGCDLLGLDTKVVEAFNEMDERNTTFIYRILSLGFRQKEIEYIKRARFAGKSKWTLWRKLSIMVDAITGFSSRPLRLITKLGLVIFAALVARWSVVFLRIYLYRETPTELTILLNSIFTSLALIILILGVIGDYIWRILDETRKRPVYQISEVGGEIFEHK